MKSEHDQPTEVVSHGRFLCSTVECLGSPGTYAGNDAIVAFARLHQLTVIIHQLNSPILEVNIQGSMHPPFPFGQIMSSPDVVEVTEENLVVFFKFSSRSFHINHILYSRPSK